jgi:HlyD family secretion protein
MQNNSKQSITPEQLQQLLAMQQSMQQNKMTRKQMIMNGIFHKMQNMLHYLDRFVNFITKKTDNQRNDVVQNARSPIIFGAYVIIIFIIFGGIWSATAPLDSAAVAIGTVISDTNRKTIQHSDHGIVKNIFVKQGDHVKEGDKLVEFDDTKTKADYENVLNQYRTVLANEARLVAERDNLDTIVFSDFLQQSHNEPEVAKIMHIQENLFRSRKEMYRAEKDSMKQKIAQLHKSVESYESRKIASSKNLEVTKDRVRSLKTLGEKGFAQKSVVLDAESKEANAKSDVASTEAEIAKTHHAITQTEIDIMTLQNKYTTETLRELKETQMNVANLRERYFLLSDSLNRIILRSPVDGIINVLHIHTIGGVVQPGIPILEISPTNDTLIIEAKVPQKNIDSVKVGLEAKIRFSAFKSRTTPLFVGKVISVSPDTVIDKNQGPAPDTYYIARIEIDMDGFNKIAKSNKLSLHPGMQAEVQIITGTRTLLRYLLDPLVDTMFRAFREK